MPFKLKVGKRAGKYELTRDLSVIQIEILQLIEEDHSLQCTISSMSTGQDCLDYVCQRLQLTQSDCMGLRYRSSGAWRWVEMDKGLRKQMDRHASESNVHLAVLYHTPLPSSITDPVARYYYYLQMKSDIVEGRLLVVPEKAILLASYSLQVDVGDHDSLLHQPNSLKGYSLLPKHMTKSTQILEDLLRQVTLAHRSLKGMSPLQAQLLYMTEAQLCEGYGQEYFETKEVDGTQVFLGYCQQGIVVKKAHNLNAVPMSTEWKDISSVVSHKRSVYVHTAHLTPTQYVMEDADAARYAAMVCQWQLTFFNQFFHQHQTFLIAEKTPVQSSNPPDVVPNECEIVSCETTSCDSPSEKEDTSYDVESVAIYKQAMENRLCHSTPHLYRVHNDIDEYDDHIPAYKAAPDYETAINHPSLDPTPTTILSPAPEIERKQDSIASANADYSSRLYVEPLQMLNLKCASSPDLVTVSLAKPTNPTVISVQPSHNPSSDCNSIMTTCGPLLCAVNVTPRPDLLVPTSPHNNTLAEMEAIVENEARLLEEFDSIPKLRPTAGLSTAQMSQNAYFNRFNDILPYEDTRLMLRPTKHNPTGYINASVIQVPIGGNVIKYIATQAPLKDTQSDFWQMVWESEARVIVMLTQCQEDGVSTSQLYWPSDPATKVRHGDIHIAMSSCVRAPTHNTCTLTLKHAPTGHKRTIYHLQYLHWAVPHKVHHFLSFVDQVGSVKRHVANDLGSAIGAPMIVHCCDGVGRTGVFILTQIMIYCLEHNHNIDVHKMLTLLRQHRMKLVQTPTQYKFVYTCLKQYLTNSRLI